MRLEKFGRIVFEQAALHLVVVGVEVVLGEGFELTGVHEAKYNYFRL